MLFLISGVLISDPGTLVAEAKTRLHTPKAVTYYEQPDYCRFMIGHSLERMESRKKKFTPHLCFTGQGRVPAYGQDHAGMRRSYFKSSVAPLSLSFK